PVVRSTPSPASSDAWAIGAAVARFPDTEEVTGSIPVSPTSTAPSVLRGGRSRCCARRRFPGAPPRPAAPLRAARAVCVYCGHMQIWPGQSYPLGATFDGSGTNFAVFSEVAERVELCLIAED